jgi:hypothetical protein
MFVPLKSFQSSYVSTPIIAASRAKELIFGTRSTEQPALLAELSHGLLESGHR